MLLWPIIMIRTENGKNGKNVSKASLAQENSSLENANVLRSLELKYAWIGFEPQMMSEETALPMCHNRCPFD